MTTIRVVKRDHTFQEFDPRKIRRAMLMAFHSVQPDRVPNVDPLVAQVVTKASKDLIHIEKIQDCVQNVLVESGNKQVASHYIAYREERSRRRAERLHPDAQNLADYIAIAKYARFLPHEKRRESWTEIIERVSAMHHRRYRGFGIGNLIDGAFASVHDKIVLPAGRHLQFGGAALEKHNVRGYNCAFTLLDRPRAFAEIFFSLLCGSGVGFSVQWKHIDRLPPMSYMSRTVKHFSIPDSIVGWAEAMHALIMSAIQGHWVEFDYSRIRPEGSPLETSGGLAPGHLPLREALEEIREILMGAANRKLRPIECFDIVCILARAVLSGGIRRSSLICLFSPEDTEMLFAKMPGHFDPMHGLNTHRALANISAALSRRANPELLQEQFQRIIRLANEGFAEPGFYFLANSDYGCNPCGEIGQNPILRYLGNGKVLSGMQFCNLTETNVARCDTAERFLEAVRHAAIIGTLQAGYTNFPYLGSITEEIVRREALLGVGLTGMADNPEIAMDPELQRKAAKLAVETNREVAEKIGINPAARVTTVKPSGTASLLLGCVGSGIHPHHARRYFRRVTANPMEPPALFFRELNPHACEVKSNRDLALIFPVEASANAITIRDESALAFLDRVYSTYDHWVKPGTAIKTHSPGLTHNVSCTVTVRDEEVDDVIESVWKNRDRISAMSFAPFTLDKRYPHAPREEVTDERWNEMIRLFNPVDWSQLHEEQDGTYIDSACEGPACEIN